VAEVGLWVRIPTSSGGIIGSRGKFDSHEGQVCSVSRPPGMAGS
jgi:hypothetical protein